MQHKKVFTVEDCYNNYLSGYIKTPFTDWLTKNRAPAAINPDLKLYVSRSQLPNKKGRFLGEKQLESDLLNEGYLIVKFAFSSYIYWFIDGLVNGENQRPSGWIDYPKPLILQP